MTTGIDHVALLGENFNLPENLDIIIVEDIAALGKETARVHSAGNSELFGTAFIQGQRLNFTTAMPWGLMLRLGVVDQPPKGAGIEEVQERSNRPKQGAHGANLRRYLRDTACHNHKFIVPAITMNCGATFGKEEVQHKVTLIIVANAQKTVLHGASAWSAVLIIPNNIKLHITDGGHRFNQSGAIVNDHAPDINEAMKATFLANAIDVRVIFEPDTQDAHQDFADCGKAKPISGSLIASYDRRDATNLYTATLVLGNDFLAEHVDATAAGVNLSAKSIKCWPMSAVRMMVDTINRLARERIGSQDAEGFDEARLNGLEDFLDAVIAKVPTLDTIWTGWQEVHEKAKERGEVNTAADLRGVRGGDLVLRASFLALVARAFDYCKVTGYDFAKMAQHLADTDWHVLSVTDEEFEAKVKAEALEAAAEKREPMAFQQMLFAHVTADYLKPLIVIKGDRYRLTASGPEVATAWVLWLHHHSLPSAADQMKLAA